MPTLQFQSLGRRDYAHVLEQQFSLRSLRQAGQIDDTILLVEHPRIITQGRRPAEEDFLIPRDMLEKKGVRVQSVNRGGRLTYHGPGQLVAYFILSLRDRGLKIPDFVRKVEETALLTLGDLGIHARRREGCPGVWVEDKKIVSIGLSVDRGVSMHGLALNINPDLQDFELIVPCGMADCKMTSLEQLLEKDISWSAVQAAFIRQAKQVFPS